MSEFKNSNFNNILRKIIKKSLFTERQVEIILNYKNLVLQDFNISKGAYFRQVSQSRNKLLGFFYTIIVLRSLGILLPDDIDVISRLSKQISVIGNNNDISRDKEDEILDVIERAMKQTSGM